MSKKSIIAIITVVVLLFIAGISVGVFLYTRGETAAVDGDQTSTTTPEQENDGNQPADGDQTENNDNSDTDSNIGNETENPETPAQDEGEEPENNNDNENNDNADNEAVNNDNTANNEGNTENNNDDENAEITTGTDVNEVGETTITRYEEVERIVLSRQFFDWWEPMAIKVDQPTVLDVEKPQLDVRKSVITGVGGDNFVYAGQDLTYVISVTNNSEVDVKNIEITDRIPENTTFASIEDAVIANEAVGTKTTINSGNVVEGVKWVVTVPAGETVVARFTVNVNEYKLDENGALVPLTGTILNTAIANGEKSTGDDGDEETKTSIITANKSSVITRIQDNEEITEGIEAARIGDIITYTITVSNTGDSEGKTFITDKVPTGTEFVSAEGDAIVSEEKDTVAWSISLAANETITRSFKVRVTSIESEIINIANVGGTDTNTDTTKVESYIVFEENGGSEVEDLTGIKGEPITDRNMPITEKPGYVFDGWYAEPEFTGEEVTNLPENYPAGTTTYYAKWTPRADLTGIVNYYLKDTTIKLAESKELTGLVFNSPVTEKAIEIPGYEKVDPTEQTITVKLEGNEINFYYKKAMIDYTVKYYYDGIQDDSKTANLKAEFDSIISTYTDKNIDGYRFEKTSGLPLKITADPANNIIEVYYVKDEFAYTVKYYKDGETEPFEVSQDLKALFGSEIKAEDVDTSNMQAGYRLDKMEGTPLKITSDPTKNIIEVYYVKDEISYTVEYYKDGEKEPFAVSQDLKALLGSQINAEDVDTSNMLDGYQLDRIEGTPLTISADPANNIIRVYYGKPDISIDKIAPKTANAGEEVTYTIKLTNSGKAKGTVTTVTDILPEGVTYVRSDNGGIYENGIVTWSSIEVPANGTTNLTVTVKINADQIGKTIENTAKLSDDTPSSTPENKTDTVTTKINEITGIEVGTKPGEEGRDANNIVLVIDLSSSMNEKIYTFVECTHEHRYTNWGREYCPEGCERQWSTGIWGKNVSQGTRLEAAKEAAQEFIREIYKDQDSKATVTVVTFNQKTDDNSNKYVGTRLLTFGRYNNKTTATNKDYQELITEIGNIDIGTATSGYGTHMKAALDEAYNTIYDSRKGLVATYPNNSNVVIFLGDGDPYYTSRGEYSDNTDDNIIARANDIKNGVNNRKATIYSIGFGPDASDPDSDAYDILGKMSSDGKVRTADDAESLADIFSNLEDEMNPEKPVETASGKITIQLEKNLVISSENQLVVEYNGETLFSCSTLPYNHVEYNANTKQLTFDVNAYNADENNEIKITNNSVVIRYFVER